MLCRYHYDISTFVIRALLIIDFYGCALTPQTAKQRENKCMQPPAPSVGPSSASSHLTVDPAVPSSHPSTSTVHPEPVVTSSMAGARAMRTVSKLVDNAFFPAAEMAYLAFQTLQKS
ncbi:hypothetical protein HPB51_022336 [Rhipicephalus microplus]|uniref:Uncharacterized protein n=1 Tax=Rhipicephalus microplus TaxID=6941 RepID=A0A9J6DQM6_RHIMP|nr:hypothetical protein HPB51_022336 [Rhipicephalus microplus]